METSSSGKAGKMGKKFLSVVKRNLDVWTLLWDGLSKSLMFRNKEEVNEI